jgi:hypothetical protein
MNAIVVGIKGDGDPKVFRDAPLEMKSPFLCRCEPEQPIGARPIDILMKKPPGRTFFTHLPYQAMPESMVRSGTKVSQSLFCGILITAMAKLVSAFIS